MIHVHYIDTFCEARRHTTAHAAGRWTLDAETLDTHRHARGLSALARAHYDNWHST